MGLHLSSFYDSLNSSPGILTESDFSLSYSSPCQPKESDLSLACHFQNRSPVCSLYVEFKFIVHYDAEIMFLITHPDQYLQWCSRYGGLLVQCGDVSIFYIKVHLPF